MNAEVDESAEERKGGSGHLGKMLMSAGKDAVRGRVQRRQKTSSSCRGTAAAALPRGRRACSRCRSPAQVAFVCHVPKALQEEKADTGFKIKEWVDAVAKAANAEVVSESEELVKLLGKANPEKELFPLKMRDAGQAAGFAYIKSKGLIPEDDSDDYIPVSGSREGGGRQRWRRCLMRSRAWQCHEDHWQCCTAALACTDCLADCPPACCCRCACCRRCLRTGRRQAGPPARAAGFLPSSVAQTPPSQQQRAACQCAEQHSQHTGAHAGVRSCSRGRGGCNTELQPRSCEVP